LDVCAGVRYVVDTGRAKEKVLDAHGAAAKYEVAWISKASAEQRAGRAGRTGPGHCYRSAQGPTLDLELVLVVIHGFAV
jgi:HrpA-like RNA helicase